MAFDIWPKFGFARNPYDNVPLPATAEGSKLLVGRDTLVDEIQAAVASGGTYPTVEGPVGVGKSSLVDVAVYRMYESCIHENDKTLYIPATVRLEPINDVAEFSAQVYRVLADTLIQYVDDFERVGLDRPDIEELDSWLNGAVFKSAQAGATFAGFGGDVGYGEEGNSGVGFELGGFPRAVERVLDSAFARGDGAIVVLIDNIELSETVAEAQRILDKLRDSTFRIPNVRWVISGARGLISRARNDRLSGYFASPIKVPPLNPRDVVEALRRRVERYGLIDATPPVTPEGFSHIYAVLNQNLRDTLSEAQRFAQVLNRDFLAKNLKLPLPDELDELLAENLFDRAKNAYEDANGVQERTWLFFDELCSKGGSCGSSEFKKFGFEKQPGMVRAITQLVDANLVARHPDPENGKLTRNSVVPSGWLVHHHRKNSAELS